jgi:hypothetical protein
MAAPQALTPAQIQQIIAAGRGNTVNIGGTLYGANYADQGSGESMQEGPLQSITGSTGIDQTGQPYYEYSPTGAFVQQGVTQKVDASKDFLKFALAAGGMMMGLPPGFGEVGAAGLTAAEAAGLGLTAAEASALGLSAAEFAAAAGTAGTIAGSSLTAAQIANLAKAGISVAGLLGAGNAVSNMGGGTTPTGVSIPTQAAPQYNADYYSRLQGAYNQALPGMPRDVVSNLAAWYGGDSGMMSGADTANAAIAKTPATLTAPMTSLMNSYRAGNVPQTKLDLNAALKAGMTTEQLMSTFNLGMQDIDYLRGQGYYLPAMKTEITNVISQELKNPATAYANIVARMDATGTNPAAVAAATNIPVEEIQNAYNQLNPTGLFANNNPNFGVVDAGTLYNIAANPTDYQTAIQEIQQYRAADEVGQQSVVERALAAELAARPGSSLSALQQAGSTYGVSAADIAAAYAKLGYA